MIMMTEPKYTIGLDVGGTWTRALLFEEKAKAIEIIREEVDTSCEVAISDQIIEMIHTLCKRNAVAISSVKGIGISSAGPLDAVKGVLIKPPNLPFDYVPLIRPVTQRFNVPTFLINDCAAAVLSEREFGRGKGISNLFYVTISTGIGGGAIVDDHLLIGKDGNAVEIGHLTLDYQGKLLCGCGRRGHWEAYCSGKNMPNYVELRVREEGKDFFENSGLAKKTGGDLSVLSSEILFNAAKSGDSFALQMIKEIGFMNAIGFANIVNAYDPTRIIVGGAVALNNIDLILPPIKKNIAEFAINRIPAIEITTLGDDVSLYGAVAAVNQFT